MVLFAALPVSTCFAVLGAGVGLAGSVQAGELELCSLSDVVEATIQESPSTERSGVCGGSVDMADYTCRDEPQCLSDGSMSVGR